MLIRYIYCTILTIFLLTGCEKVIDINLNESNPRLVVEGELTDQTNPVILLSRTTNFFGPDEFPKVSGAQIVISDDAGRTDTLEESTQPGRYFTQQFVGISDRTYTLTIKTDTATYQTHSYMPPPVPIDSVSYEYQPGNQLFTGQYFVTIYFKDPAHIENYYLFEFSLNEQDINLEEEYIVLSDADFNGKVYGYEFNFPRDSSEVQQDTLYVKLHAMDEQGYEFYKTLNETESSGSVGGPFSGTPQNPTTNLNKDALGYFGTFSITTEKHVIE